MCAAHHILPSTVHQQPYLPHSYSEIQQEHPSLSHNNHSMIPQSSRHSPPQSLPGSSGLVWNVPGPPPDPFSQVEAMARPPLPYVPSQPLNRSTGATPSGGSTSATGSRFNSPSVFPEQSPFIENTAPAVPGHSSLNQCSSSLGLIQPLHLDSGPVSSLRSSPNDDKDAIQAQLAIGHDSDEPSMKKKKRATRACDACRKAKVACNGLGANEESCSMCQLKGIPCTYVETSKRRAPPKGYIDELEARITVLERLLDSLAPGFLEKFDAENGDGLDDISGLDNEHNYEDDEGLDGGTDDKRGLQRKPSNIRPSTGQAAQNPKDSLLRLKNRSIKRSAMAANMQSQKDKDSDTKPGLLGSQTDLDDLANALSDMTMDGRYFGESSTYRLVQKLKETGSGQAATSPTNQQNQDAFTRLPWADERSYVEMRMEADLTYRTAARFPLPSREVCLPFVELFFTHVHPTVPILHRASFMAAFEEVVRDRKDEAVAALLFAVLALGARFSKDPVIYTDFGMLFAKAPAPERNQKYAAGYALAMASFYCTPRWATRTPLYTLQQGALLAHWHLGGATPLMAWQGVFSCIKGGIDTGAHRNNSKTWTTDNLTDQLRKRAFWALVILDRSLACHLGRAVTLQDGDIDLQLPWEIDDDDLDALANQSPATTKWKGSSSNVKTSQDAPSFRPVSPLACLRCEASLSRTQHKALKTIYAPKSDSLRKLVEQSITQSSPGSASRWQERMVAELDSDLNQWYHALPTYLRWDDKRSLNTDNDILLAILSAQVHVRYFGTQILVHREFIDSEHQGVLTWPSLSMCHNNARSLCHVVAYLHRNDLLKYCWTDIPLQVMNTATLLLLSISEHKKASSESSNSVLADIQKCIDAMLDMSDICYIAYQATIGIKAICASQDITQNLRFELPTKSRDFSGIRINNIHYQQGQSQHAQQHQQRPAPVQAPSQRTTENFHQDTPLTAVTIMQNNAMQATTPDNKPASQTHDFFGPPATQQQHQQSFAYSNQGYPNQPDLQTHTGSAHISPHQQSYGTLPPHQHKQVPPIRGQGHVQGQGQGQVQAQGQPSTQTYSHYPAYASTAYNHNVPGFVPNHYRPMESQKWHPLSPLWSNKVDMNPQGMPYQGQVQSQSLPNNAAHAYSQAPSSANYSTLNNNPHIYENMQAGYPQLPVENPNLPQQSSILHSKHAGLYSNMGSM